MKVEILYEILKLVGVNIILVLSVLLLDSCDNSKTQPEQSVPPTITNTIANLSNSTVNVSMGQNTPTSTPNDRYDWQKQWLQGQPCRPPCFEGIAPGYTTANEAITILQKQPDVAIAKIAYGDGNYLGWNWDDGYNANSTKYTTQGGTAQFRLKDVSQIVYLISPAINRLLNLEEIMNTYGEPTYVGAYFLRGPRDLNYVGYSVRLVYLSQGFVVGSSTAVKPVIDKNLNFDSINFFVPTTAGYKEAFPGEEYQTLVPWTGFNSFGFYCQTQLRNGPEECTKV